MTDHHQAQDRVTGGSVREDYLSPGTLGEAAHMLAGLARALDGVQGVWVEEAREDAAQIREVAHALATWAGPGARRDPWRLARPRTAHGPAWSEVLSLYLRPAPAPETT